MSREASLIPSNPSSPDRSELTVGVVRNAGITLAHSRDVLRVGFAALQSGDYSRVMGDESATRACVEAAWDHRNTAVDQLCLYVEETYDEVFEGLASAYGSAETDAKRTHAWRDTWWRLFGALASSGVDAAKGPAAIQATAEAFDALSKQKYSLPGFHDYARERDPCTRIFYDEVFKDFIPISASKKKWPE
jgi:hypothetical protein